MSKNIENQENIDFEYLLFPTTHNSFSKKDFKDKKGTLDFQINSGITSFEFDVHDKDGKGNFIFSIGHLVPGDDVYSDDTNPSTNHLKDWLISLKDAVNNNLEAIKGPIIVWFDLKSLLTFNGPENDIFAFNNLLLDVFERTGKNQLFRPRRLIELAPKYNMRDKMRMPNFKKEDTPWPSLDELKGNFICVFTGGYINSKFEYIKKIDLKDRACFSSFTYGWTWGFADGLGWIGKSRRVLQESLFINKAASGWKLKFAKKSYEPRKLIRLYYFNNSVYSKIVKSSKLPKYKCNFPATDEPFDDWYGVACNRLQKNNVPPTRKRKWYDIFRRQK